jgi:hypothetical protein
MKENMSTMTDLCELRVLSQRPEMTGSGIYLEALIRESRKRGIPSYRPTRLPNAMPAMSRRRGW